MTKTEFLIVGQGICGTLLSWYLLKKGASVRVIDEFVASSSSRVAAGVINPVTGRRIVKTWMIDTLLPFAKNAYTSLGNELGISLVEQKNIVDLFPSGQMRIAFQDRIADDPQYLALHDDDHRYDHYFNYSFGSGDIIPCYLVQLQQLLAGERKRLLENKLLSEEKFDIDQLKLTATGVHYRDIEANKIIFCDGASSAHNPYFRNLPFSLNKGEALIIRCDDLPQTNVYKKATTLVPLGENFFWVGSSYEWEYQDDRPTATFFEKTKKQLQHWLKVPFYVENHVAAIRPATLERRPFIGLHPAHPAIAIFNGMGTKGCSLAPYFADQFAGHLLENSSILAAANINRFSNILQSSK